MQLPFGCRWDSHHSTAHFSAGAPGRSMAAFPQPRSLSAALLETQLLVLGPLTAAVSEANQLQILGVGLLSAMETHDDMAWRDIFCYRQGRSMPSHAGLTMKE